MSLKHAILGFLSFKSLSGYDLKKVFDHSIQHFWPANQSQIYRTLAELKSDGWVDQEVIEREERLDMKVYHITDGGRQELHHWLSSPLPPTDYREPFLIQVYFGGLLTDKELVELLHHEIRDMEERLAVYDSIYKMYPERISTSEDPRSLFLSVATLEYGILSNESSLEWLKSVIERVQAGEYRLRDFQPK
jgi:DNA-binding PadR family transcriptional regulator